MFLKQTKIRKYVYRVTPLGMLLGTHPQKNKYEDNENGPIYGRGGSYISLKKYFLL